MERKEVDKLIRKAENTVKLSEEKIEKLEAEMEEISTKLSDPAQINGDHSLFEKYDLLKKQLETEMANWEKMNEQLDELKQQRF